MITIKLIKFINYNKRLYMYNTVSYYILQNLLANCYSYNTVKIILKHAYIIITQIYKLHNKYIGIHENDIISIRFI